MVQHSIRKSYEDQNPSVIIQNNQSRYSLANTAESMSPIQYTQLVSGEESPSATMIISGGPITPPSTSPAHYSTLQSAIAGNVQFGGVANNNQYHQPNHYHTININNNNNNNNNIAYVDFNYQLSLDLSHKTAGADKTGGIDDDADDNDQSHSDEAGVVDEKSINQIRIAAHQQHQHQHDDYQQKPQPITDDDNDHIVRAKIAANHHHYTSNIHTHQHHLHTDPTASSHMHLVDNGVLHHHQHQHHHQHDLLTEDHQHHQQHHISPESAALRNGLLPIMYASSSAVYSSATAANATATETGSSSHSPVPISSTSDADTNGLLQYNYGHTSVLVATGTTTTTPSTAHIVNEMIADTLKDEPDHSSLTGGDEQTQYLTLTSVQDLQQLKDQHYLTDPHHHHQHQHHTTASTSSGGDSRGSPSGLSQTDFEQNFTHLTSAVAPGGRKLYGSGEHGLLHGGGGAGAGYDMSIR